MNTFLWPGLIVVDSSLNLVASNLEAIQILTFPRHPPQGSRLRALLARQIRDRLVHSPAATPPGFVNEFPSARRTYCCRAVPLNLDINAGAPPNIVLMLERKTNGLCTIAEVLRQFGLTKRETITVQLLFQGLTGRQIAEEMKISPNTVKAFIRLIMLKTGVSTRSGILSKIIGEAHLA